MRNAMHIVLLGGGHAHLEVLRRFGRRPQAGVRLSLITKGAHAPYSGMLPGFVAGHYSADEIHVPLAPLTQRANCALVVAEATRLDAERRSILLSDGREIAGDVISINTGAVTDCSTGTSAERCVAAKPIDDFAQDWTRLMDVIEADPTLRIAVIGAGAAGVELALSIQHRLMQMPFAGGRIAESRVSLVGGDDILPSFPAKVRQRVARLLRGRGVTFLSGPDIEVIATRGLSGAGFQHVLVWATGVRPANWLTRSGLALDHAGFVAVDRHLQSKSHEGIFCAGDAAGLVDGPQPKAGVIAVRQGPVLGENLRRYASGRQLQSFAPPKIWLSLISTGNRYAVASRGKWSVEGRWTWYWKDWIDRRFVRKYKQ